MKLLILLTAAFPYDSGEEFLSNELNYIKGFDKIIVCPCNTKPGSVKTKQLPNGVCCVPVKNESSGRAGYIKFFFKPCVLYEILTLIRNGQFSAGRVHETLFFMRNAVRIYRSLKNLPELKPADDITVYSYWFYDAAAGGALLAGFLRKFGKRVRLISRAHGFDIHSERAKYGYLPMRKFLLSNISTLFPCSVNGAETLKSQYPKYAGKIKTAYLGTPDRGIKLGVQSKFHIVSCSYMVPVKRLHMIANALKQADFPAVWTHIGTGPLEEEIRALTLDFPPNVQCEFAGAMENGAIMDYYKNNDISVFVNVSSSEGIPVSVMEACSFGIPVIATDVGGTGEIVSDGENGYLLPKDFSLADFLDKLRLIINMDVTEYDKMCEKSRAIWSEKFSAEKNYGKFYEVLSQ